MSIVGLVSLVCALATGVSATDAAPWGQIACMVFLMLAIASFAVSTLQRPSLLWEVIDDLHGKRILKSQRMQAIHGKRSSM